MLVLVAATAAGAGWGIAVAVMCAHRCVARWAMKGRAGHCSSGRVGGRPATQDAGPGGGTAAAAAAVGVMYTVAVAGDGSSADAVRPRSGLEPGPGPGSAAGSLRQAEDESCSGPSVPFSTARQRSSEKARLASQGEKGGGKGIGWLACSGSANLLTKCD